MVDPINTIVRARPYSHVKLASPYGGPIGHIAVLSLHCAGQTEKNKKGKKKSHDHAATN